MRDLRRALVIALIANLGAGVFWLSRPARDDLADVMLASAWTLAGITFLVYERRLRSQGTAAPPLRYSGIFLIVAAIVAIGRVVVLRLD